MLCSVFFCIIHTRFTINHCTQVTLQYGGNVKYRGIHHMLSHSRRWVITAARPTCEQTSISKHLALVELFRFFKEKHIFVVELKVICQINTEIIMHSLLENERTWYSLSSIFLALFLYSFKYTNYLIAYVRDYSWSEVQNVWPPRPSGCYLVSCDYARCCMVFSAGAKLLSETYVYIHTWVVVAFMKTCHN